MNKMIVFAMLLCTASTQLQAQTDSLQRLGIQYVAEGRHQEAVRTLLLAGADSGNAFVRSQLGLAYAGLNDFPNARRHLCESVALAPDDVPRRFVYARFLHLSLLLNEANAQYVEVVRRDSTYGAAWFQLGQISRLLGATDSLQAAFYERALAVNPEDYLSLHYLGSILLDDTTNSRGLRLLEASLARNPQFLPAAERLASYYFGKNLNAMAIQYYRWCAELRPKNPEFQFYLGESFRRLRLTDSAVVHLTAAIGLDSSKSSYRAQLGYAYFLAEKFNSAAEAYRDAIRIDEDTPQYYVNLALVLERLDATEMAANALEGAIRALDPHQIGLMYEKLGGVYFRAGDFQQSAGAYEKSLVYFPENKEASFYLAMALDQGRQVKSAISRYRGYLRLIADDTVRNARHRYIEDRIQYLEGLPQK